MSDISIRQVQASPERVTNVSHVKSVNTDMSTDTDLKQVQDKENEEAGKVQEEERLDNVVSVSEHGDTVQVSNEGFSKLEEDEEIGRVTIKSENSQIPEEETRKKISDIFDKSEPIVSLKSDTLISDDKDTGKDIGKGTDKGTDKEDTSATSVNSYSGYTDSQLEQLYLRGEISKFNYDKEIESREAQREELKEDDKKFTNQMAENIAGVDDAARNADEIKMAFSNDASKTLSPGDRIDMIQAMENLDLNQKN